MIKGGPCISGRPFSNFKALHSFKSIGSTNDYLKDTAIAPKTVAIAAVQTKGRGKHGARWVSGKGGLWFSFVLKDNLKDPYFYVILSSVAVAMALEEHGLRPVIKWPNDITINGLKICGMLIEKDGFNKRVVTGIGINVNNKVPKGEGIKAISLKALKIKETPYGLLEKTLRIADNLIGIRPRRKVVMEWVKRQSGLEGREIKLIRRGTQCSYTVKGVTDKGALVVKGPKGKQITLNGEIFFG